MGAFGVAVGFVARDPEALDRWRAFVDQETVASVTIMAANWLEMVSHPLFPPEIVVLPVGGCSLRALGSQIHTCRQLGVLVILADPLHIIDSEFALRWDTPFILREEAEAKEILAAVRSYREARATGNPVRLGARS